MGAQKLALVQAAKTAKGAMVKYAMPNVKKTIADIKKNPLKLLVDRDKFQKGKTLGMFDAVKSTAKGLYQAGKYLITTNSVQKAIDIAKVTGNVKKGVQYAYNNPKQTINAIKSGAINAAKTFINSSAMEKGRVVGRIEGEIALAYVGTKGIDKLAKVARGSTLLAGAKSASGLVSAGEAGISASNAARIQNAANRTKQEITVVGSRANRTASPTSDWDYLMSGNSAKRHSARGSVPRGTAGGEINSMGRETGIDIFTNYPNAPFHLRVELDPTKPHVIFKPQK